MNLSSTYMLFVLLLVSAFVLSCVVLVRRVRGKVPLSSRGMLAAASPGTVMLGLFYALAWHMHASLGAWPTSIGERGFSPALLTHSQIATSCFSMLLLASMFAWPVAFILCSFVRPWRRWTAYLSVYFLSVGSCIGLMLLAPARFLYWWWD